MQTWRPFGWIHGRLFLCRLPFCWGIAVPIKASRYLSRVAFRAVLLTYARFCDWARLVRDAVHFSRHSLHFLCHGALSLLVAAVMTAPQVMNSLTAALLLCVDCGPH